MKTFEVIRVMDGKETRLGRSSISPKAAPWHMLRIQRNTIISKDFIETFFDGQLAVTVEDQSLATGRVGLLVRGHAQLDFDSVHAIPLFSQRPFLLLLPINLLTFVNDAGQMHACIAPEFVVACI